MIFALDERQQEALRPEKRPKPGGEEGLCAGRFPARYLVTGPKLIDDTGLSAAALSGKREWPTS
jgi:hypothetical protein